MRQHGHTSPPIDTRKCVKLADGKIIRVRIDEAAKIVREGRGNYSPKRAFKLQPKEITSSGARERE